MGYRFSLMGLQGIEMMEIRYILREFYLVRFLYKVIKTMKANFLIIIKRNQIQRSNHQFKAIKVIKMIILRISLVDNLYKLLIILINIKMKKLRLAWMRRCKSNKAYRSYL